MKVSHILYKVGDLDEAVKKYRNDGFVVEYGKLKNPHNAIVYFSDGPFLEIFKRSGMPKIAKSILRFFGKKDFINRLDLWDNAPEGLIGVCLENYKKDLDEEIKILKNNNQKYFPIKASRTDTKGRKLNFFCIFPDKIKIPFFMTYYNIDPKPKNFIHPNGVKGIKSISFGTSKELIPIINNLCDDKILKLFIGEGVRDLEYEYFSIRKLH